MSAFNNIKDSIGNSIKNSLALDIPLKQALDSSKSALTNFWNNFPNVFESTRLSTKVDEKIKKSIADGLPFNEALSKVGDDLKKAVEFWTPIFTSSFNFLADTLYLGFQSINRRL